MSLVYEPAEDSYLLESVIKRYCKNKAVLDMCTGTGILAKSALDNGAKSVTAVDINKSALDSIKETKIKKIRSSLFQKVKGKFDLIICNPPYLPKDQNEDKESELATTGGDDGDEFILKFLDNVKKHMEKEGVILLLVSSLTPMDKINKKLEKERLVSKVIASITMFFEKLEVLEIKQ
ncbi:methyltransferase [Candidatus Pacearchaeota archaeon]|nr:methyltransferase [Candidatus Pacearchaeota archaeon]